MVVLINFTNEIINFIMVSFIKQLSIKLIRIKDIMELDKHFKIVLLILRELLEIHVIGIH